ncbi:glycosyltransferase family 39 protein [Achromobacter aloeverae]|nr:glycosyltransferase family 39 protein [Achromobacter aloeverae]
MTDFSLSSESPGARAGTLAASETFRLSMLLAVQTIIWAVGSWIYRSNLDPAADMLENYVWGIEWQPGYYKHPPAFAWIAAAWFKVFPHTDLAYFALSSVNATMGICGIVALARRFLPLRDALIVGLAMAVTPIYSTLAIKFNANTVLLSLWPWTAYFFIRYVQTGTRKSAAAFGAAAALAMLGKYFSITLLIGLGLAGLVRPTWRAQLLRPRTLLVLAACAVVLGPHLAWLVKTHFPTFTYADERMHETGGGHPFYLLLLYKVPYALIQLAYLLPALALLSLLLPGRRLAAAGLMLRSIVQPSLDRNLWWLSMGTFFAVCSVSLASRTPLSALWGNTQWFAIATFWLFVLKQHGLEPDTRRIVRGMTAYWALVLALSTVLGYVEASQHKPMAIEPRAELSRAARQLWRDRVGLPLPIVSGSDKEAKAIAFYGRDLTHYWDMYEPANTPWLTRADVTREGALFVCKSADGGCIQTATAATGSQPISVTVHKRAWGLRLPDFSYTLFLLPPAGWHGAGRPVSGAAPAAS